MCGSAETPMPGERYYELFELHIPQERRRYFDSQGSPPGASLACFVSKYPSSTLFPFLFGVSLLKLNIRNEAALIVMGSLRNLVLQSHL